MPGSIVDWVSMLCTMRSGSRPSRNASTILNAIRGTPARGAYLLRSTGGSPSVSTRTT